MHFKYITTYLKFTSHDFLNDINNKHSIKYRRIYKTFSVTRQCLKRAHACVCVHYLCSANKQNLHVIIRDFSFSYVYLSRSNTSIF